MTNRTIVPDEVNTAAKPVSAAQAAADDSVAAQAAASRDGMT